jgi:hypothetical protein
MPKPVVTVGANVVSSWKFSYPAGASPTTLANVSVTVTLTPALASSSAFKSALSSGGCSLANLSTVRCALGNVRAGQTRTVFIAVAAPSAGSFSESGVALWNEALSDKNPQPTNDSVNSDPLSVSTVVVATNAPNAVGGCTLGGSSASTSQAVGSTNQVATVLQYPGTTQDLPCTPFSIRDDDVIGSFTCGSRPCVFSTLFLPLITPLGATATLTFDGSLFPGPGPAPKPAAFRVLEFVPGSTALSQVPLCSSGATSPGGACEDFAVRFGMRGIQAVLRVSGLPVDPSYGR